MKVEYLLLVLVVWMIIDGFFQKRKYQKLWQSVDKSKYIDCYRQLFDQTNNQTQAIKQLRQQFGELGLLQAIEIRQLAQQSSIKP